MRVTPESLSGLRTDVPLTDFTTIGLGGKAKYLVRCGTTDSVKSALTYAKDEKLAVQILGGGSNVIFRDDGFDGLVVKIDLKGVTFKEEAEGTFVTAAAGEVWDDLVSLCIGKNLAGIECLSGIPGSVGATPIQNVGAYGQEVKDTIVSVDAIDRESLEPVEFASNDCRFGYRTSRFKSEDINRFVIVGVSYRLVGDGEPELKYEELRKQIEAEKERTGDRKKETGGREKKTSLNEVREAVLSLRRKKSMVVDDSDPNSRSVGSFFVNPVLTSAQYEAFLGKLKDHKIERAPAFEAVDGVKLSAAWLVENAGFPKGYRQGGVGISSNHALALVNRAGTTRELLSLAAAVEEAVFRKFGVLLEREAVVVQKSDSHEDESANKQRNITTSEFQK